MSYCDKSNKLKILNGMMIRMRSLFSDPWEFSWNFQMDFRIIFRFLFWEMFFLLLLCFFFLFLSSNFSYRWVCLCGSFFWDLLYYMKLRLQNYFDSSSDNMIFAMTTNWREVTAMSSENIPIVIELQRHELNSSDLVQSRLIRL